MSVQIPDEGVYTLTQNVPNPFPDRRSPRNCNWEQWPKGFVVRVEHMSKTWFSVRFPDGSVVAADTDHEHPRHRVALKFVGCLEPSPRVLGHVLRDTNVSAVRILAMLIDLGVVTFDQVDDAVRLCDGLVAPEEFDRKHCLVAR